VFWAARNNSGIPKQLAARLTAREGFPPKSEILADRQEQQKTSDMATENNPKKRRTAGRKPKSDPAVFRYGIKLNSEEIRASFRAVGTFPTVEIHQVHAFRT